MSQQPTPSDAAARPIRLTDVARQAGVSRTTASLVLSPGPDSGKISAERAAHVREVARRLGYVPNYHARTMRLGRAQNIAFALDTGDDYATGVRLGNNYFGNMVGGSDTFAAERGYATTVFGSTQDRHAAEQAVEALQQRRVDGLILPGWLRRNIGLVTSGRIDALNAVVIEYARGLPFPVVDFDEPHGVRLALRHLAELGHRRLLYVGGEPLRDESSDDRRRAVFDREAADLDMRLQACLHEPTPNRWAEPGLTRPVEDPAVILAQQRLAEWLGGDRDGVTAIVCYNDITAIGVCRALAAAGLRVPQDMSVVGFDNFEAQYAIPPLTTIDHRVAQMGAKAAEVLIDMVEQPARRAHHMGRRHVIQPRIVVRASTGPARETA